MGVGRASAVMEEARCGVRGAGAFSRGDVVGLSAARAATVVRRGRTVAGSIGFGGAGDAEIETPTVTPTLRVGEGSADVG